MYLMSSVKKDNDGEKGKKKKKRKQDAAVQGIPIAILILRTGANIPDSHKASDS